MAPRTVNIAPLKALWLNNLKPSSALRALIASEPDEMSYGEWAMKVPIFQRMLRHELANGLVA